MLNMNLILEAKDLVNDFFAAENLYEADESIIKRAKVWYEHTEITDAETLAAVVLYGEFKPGIRHDEIMKIKHYYFPSEPFELHIGEIEAALADAMWR